MLDSKKIIDSTLPYDSRIQKIYLKELCTPQWRYIEKLIPSWYTNRNTIFIDDSIIEDNSKVILCTLSTVDNINNSNFYGNIICAVVFCNLKKLFLNNLLISLETLLYEMEDSIVKEYTIVVSTPIILWLSYIQENGYNINKLLIKPIDSTVDTIKIAKKIYLLPSKKSINIKKLLHRYEWQNTTIPEPICINKKINIQYNQIKYKEIMNYSIVFINNEPYSIYSNDNIQVRINYETIINYTPFKYTKFCINNNKKNDIKKKKNNVIEIVQRKKQYHEKIKNIWEKEQNKWMVCYNTIINNFIDTIYTNSTLQSINHMGRYINICIESIGSGCGKTWLCEGITRTSNVPVIWQRSNDIYGKQNNLTPEEIIIERQRLVQYTSQKIYEIQNKILYDINITIEWDLLPKIPGSILIIDDSSICNKLHIKNQQQEFFNASCPYMDNSIIYNTKRYITDGPIILILHVHDTIIKENNNLQCYPKKLLNITQPNKEQRYNLLIYFLKKSNKKIVLSDDIIKYISESMYGYTPSDIYRIVYNCIESNDKNFWQKNIHKYPSTLSQTSIFRFISSTSKKIPSHPITLKDNNFISNEQSNSRMISWKNKYFTKIIGEDIVINEQYNTLKGTPNICSNILQSGYPGTGKTFIANCIANEWSMPMYVLNMAQVISKVCNYYI